MHLVIFISVRPLVALGEKPKCFFLTEFMPFKFYYNSNFDSPSNHPIYNITKARTNQPGRGATVIKCMKLLIIPKELVEDSSALYHGNPWVKMNKRHVTEFLKKLFLLASLGFLPDQNQTSAEQLSGE